MRKTIIILLALLPFMSFAQTETIYLNENFNKSTIPTFPPYGWRNIDHDGDGRGWLVSADGAMDAQGNQTMSATSHTWLFQDLDPDNWMITPPLFVEKDTDSIKYWLGSYQGAPQGGQIYISNTGYDIEDFSLIDEVTFNGTYTNITRSISLKDYIGDTVYIAFRHTKVPDCGIALALDNVQGPQIVPFANDLSISELKGFSNPSCNIDDTKITITLENMGSQPVSNFKVYYQCQGQVMDEEEGHTHVSFSDLFSETVTQSIAPGASLDFECNTALPFGEYNTGAIYIRAVIDLANDEYRLNDTLVVGFIKQESLAVPFYVGFEQSPDVEDNYQGWYISPREAASGAPFTIGQNPNFANTGNNYMAVSVYVPFSSGYPAVNGEDAYAATRCLQLEAEKDYRVDLAYAFRKFPASQEPKKLNFRLLLGTEQKDLLNDHTVLLDTTLVSTKPLIGQAGEKAEYELFSSNYFSIPESGTYYVGIMIYSDEPVKEVADEWMIFLDDFYLGDRDFERPVDLSLNGIIVPYGCNLTEEEPVAFVVRNMSPKPSEAFTMQYRINNGAWVSQTVSAPLQPNEQKQFAFDTPVNLSSYRKYKVEGSILHEGEEVLGNNEREVATENKRVKGLPYIDDFETYGITENFEDEYFIYSTGYYSWMAAADYTDPKQYAYNGEGFLADAYGTEKVTAPDDWLISCCLQFEQGKEYEISFAYRIEAVSVVPAKLTTQLLSSYDTSSLVVSLGTMEIISSEYQIFKAYYTPQEDQVGHLALHSCGELQAPIIMIDALSIKESEVSIEEAETPEHLVVVFPNPATDHVNIVAESSIRSIEVYNMLGMQLYNRTFAAGAVNNHGILLSDYDKGYYVVQIQLHSGEKVVRKMIVQ